MAPSLELVLRLALKSGSDGPGRFFFDRHRQMSGDQPPGIWTPRPMIWYPGSMVDHSPEAIAARLDDAQRDVVLSGPASFGEADSLPEGLFEHDLSWDRETGDETHFWVETELGRQVRDVLRGARGVGPGEEKGLRPRAEGARKARTEGSAYGA